MKFPGIGGQQAIHDYYDASGTIATGGTAQLMLPQRKSCSGLFFQNLSTGNLFLQVGVRPATAVLTNGVVTSVTVNDAGMLFNQPPTVLFLGGGNQGDPTTFGGSLIGWPTPANVAQGRAVMTGSAGAMTISSIEIDNGGSGYLAPPFVYILPQRTDPTGVGVPSATEGILVPASGGTFGGFNLTVPTTAIAVFGATTGQGYTCKWMD